MSVYLQEFTSLRDIEEQYEAKLPDDIEIRLAWYGYGCYCGSSIVIYVQDGEIYEVNGGHCSCYGLEGQWRPEKTTVAALKMRSMHKFDEEYDGGKEAAAIYTELLDTLTAEGFH